MTNIKAPKVRFSGYNEAWNLTPLKQVAVVNPVDALPQSFEYVDLASVVGTEIVSHRLERRETAPSRAQRLARAGDIFYQTVRPYQKNNHLFQGADTDYVFSTGYAQLRPNVEGDFLFAALQRDAFLLKVLDRCTGTSFPAIAPTDLQEIEGPNPICVEEQEQIGSFFADLDDTIAAHRKKLTKLQQTKTSLLQRMFPQGDAVEPELRIDGFTGKWKQARLGDVAIFINGRAYSQNELLDVGKYPVLRVGNFYTNTNWYYSDLELSENMYANNGDLLYTWSATFGPHIWSGGKVIYHYHIWKVETSTQLEKLFAVQLLTNDRESLLSGHSGSTMPHITKEGMENKLVVIPDDILEQRAIGELFSQLDGLITGEQLYVEKLRQVKASLLQKMFV